MYNVSVEYRPEISPEIGPEIGPEIRTEIGTEIGPETLETIVVTVVTRDDILDGARRGFAKSTFHDAQRLNVRFSGEAGVDDGGPTREFMRLALKPKTYQLAVCSTLTHSSEARKLTAAGMPSLNGFNSRCLHVITSQEYRGIRLRQIISFPLLPPPTDMQQYTSRKCSGIQQMITTLPSAIAG